MHLTSTVTHPIKVAADMVDAMPDSAKFVSHAVGIGGILAGFIHAIPTIISVISGMLALVWWGLQVYNHPTVQAWLARRKAAKAAAQAD